jgi:hypothetical protein
MARITTVALLMIVLTAIAPADDDEISVDFAADFAGKYIWRGQNLDDDPVFQPSIGASLGNFTASVWGNHELTNYNRNGGDMTEIDYALDYSDTVPGIDALGFSIGVIHYEFHSQSVPDTTELYWSLALDAPPAPTFTAYHDVDEADGSYLTFGVSHTFERIVELGPAIPIDLELGATLGWGSASYNDYYWTTDQSKLNDLVLSAGFPVELAGFTVTGFVNYVSLLSDDIRDTDAYDTASDYFYAGIGISRSF